MGDLCECRFIDRQCAFTGVEFRLPDDPPTPQLCVLCSRKATQKMFYDMCYAGVAPKGVIQRFGNIFGQPGEYSAELMLSCPQGVSLSAMPLPIMSHQRSRYSVCNQGGFKTLRQHRLRVQRLQPGGLFYSLPVFEGDLEEDPRVVYVPASARLDAHVRWIHAGAREGRIDEATAERHLNAHLAAAAKAERPELYVMPTSDAPQFGNLPDLWRFVSCALSETHPCPLSAAIRQAFPCFRKPETSVEPPRGSAAVLVNLVLGTMLALYPSATSKPQFGLRVRVFASVSMELTRDGGEAFAAAHPALVSLALLEYLALVIPALYPAEEAFLRESFGLSHFFEQGPLLCNDFRAGFSSLASSPYTPLAPAEWACLNARAREAIDKTTRGKRKPTGGFRSEMRMPCASMSSDYGLMLECPLVPQGTADDYRVMTMTMGFHEVFGLERFHALVEVGPLPDNIRRMQLKALLGQTADQRSVRVRSRLFICPACLAAGRSVAKYEFRVDTLKRGLLCSACRCGDIVGVDLMVRRAPE